MVQYFSSNSDHYYRWFIFIILQTFSSRYWKEDQQPLHFAAERQGQRQSSKPPKIEATTLMSPAQAPLLVVDGTTLTAVEYPPVLDSWNQNTSIAAELVSGDSNSAGSHFLLMCRVCNYSTSSISDYHNHLVYHHDHDPKTMLCPFCDYVAPKMDNFKVHLRKHTGEKPFACSFCSYRCAHSSNMKVHMRRCAEKSGFLTTLKY